MEPHVTQAPNYYTEITKAADLAQPLYKVIQQQITELIVSGEWPAGTALPSEVALAQSFGVAVGTVRRALMDLTNQGLLSRRRKTGTVVTGRTPHHSLRFYYHYFRLHGVDGALKRSVARVNTVARGPANPVECERLQISPDEEVIRIERVRHVDGRPVMIDSISLLAELVPGLCEDPEAFPQLLYLHIFERYGIRISAIREQIGAALATEADAALLDIRLPEALLVIDEIAYDQSAVPVLCARHRALTTSLCYVNEVQ